MVQHSCKEGNMIIKKNFIFLQERWSDLALFASQAEDYIFTDPQSSLLKLRLFSEVLVGYIYRDLQLPIDKQWNYFDKLNNAEFSSAIRSSILSKLHAIRIKGNNAAHKGIAKSEDALWLVREAHTIALWLYNSYNNGEDYNIEFITPMDSGKREDHTEKIIIELEASLQREKELQEKFNALNLYKNDEKIETFRLVNNSVPILMNDDEVKKRITIEEIFLDYQLTSGQTELVKSLETFLKDKTQNVFLLKGYAGTGKTFITKGLTEYFCAIGRNFILSAPTGKAAKVIREKTGHKALTIHSSIYSNKNLKEYKASESDRTYKFYFELSVNEDSDDTVYIIDEASMVSDVYSEMEFFRFGSGHLLKDLMKYINLDANDHNKKVIFIGDNAQLPPVGMEFSPALQTEYLQKEFSLPAQTYELIEVVRQKEDSGILKNAINLRKSLSKHIFNQLVIDKSTDDIQSIESSTFMDKFLEISDNKISKDTVVISYTNEAVKSYNQAIREHFFQDTSVINTGDKIILVSNNNNHEIQLSNGDFGLVKSILGSTEHKRVQLKRKTNDTVERIDINLYFRDIEIIFKDQNDKPYVMQCKIIENLLFSGLANLSSDEHKAIYLDFVMRNNHLRPNTEEFKVAIKSDPYFNALRVKFGYAVTCHKAQGSEWKNVMLDCSYSHNQLSESYFRWLYTALTRASESLYLLNEPHISIFGKISIPTIEALPIQETKIEVKSEPITELKPNNSYTFDIKDEFLESVFQDVSSKIIADDIIITNIIHNSYQEIYTFERDKLTCRASFSYNSKSIVTNISLIETNQLAEDLKVLLASIIGHLITTQEHDTFEFSTDFLEEFYHSLKDTLLPCSIAVANIEHNSWMERYTFTRENEIAVIDFYYNKKGQFKSPTPNNRSNSDRLIKDILSCLS